MHVAWRELRGREVMEAREFVLAHEAEMVPVAEEMREIERAGRGGMCLTAWWRGEMVGVFYVTRDRVLFPCWEARYNTVMRAALGDGGAVLEALGAVCAIMGRGEVVRCVSEWVARNASRAYRRVRMDYTLMTWRRGAMARGRVGMATAEREAMAAAGRGVIQVEQGGMRDLRGIFPLHVAYLREEVQLEHEAVDPRTALDQLVYSLRRHTYFVARHRSLSVGKANSNAEGYGCAQLGGIFTQRQYRGRGIGYRCTVALCRALFARYPLLVLFVKPRNAVALSLYQAVGFRAVGDYAIHYLKDV